jgi:transaldolase
MELWLDTVDFNVIEDVVSKLNVSGITTNPSILATSKLSFRDTIAKLLEVQDGLVAIQVVATDVIGMISQAERLYLLNSRIIIKVPVTKEGLQVIKHLSQNNIPTIATAVFEPRQVLLASLVGAKYVSPYLGRIEQGLIVLKEMLQLLEMANYSTKILAAAIRSVEQVLSITTLGSQAITVPVQVLEELLQDNPNTLQSLLTFQKAWQGREDMAWDFR